jgi:hypothetical protein
MILLTCMQVGQIPEMMLVTKKGSQQIMKTPITVPEFQAFTSSIKNYLYRGYLARMDKKQMMASQMF